MAPALSTLASRGLLAREAARAVAEALRFGIATRRSACAALSGGTTPEPAYVALAQQQLPWSDVTLALVDERFVPPDDPASNEGLLRRSLAPALAAGARLSPMFGAGTPMQAATKADASYTSLHIDIAVMGMGADGHTASWFPGAPALDSVLDLSNAQSVMALRADNANPIKDRLTLTRAALARADRLLLLITGEDKRVRFEAGDAPVHALFAPEMPPCEVLYAP